MTYDYTEMMNTQRFYLNSLRTHWITVFLKRVTPLVRLSADSQKYKMYQSFERYNNN